MCFSQYCQTLVYLFLGAYSINTSLKAPEGPLLVDSLLIIFPNESFGISLFLKKIK